MSKIAVHYADKMILFMYTYVITYISTQLVFMRAVNLIIMQMRANFQFGKISITTPKNWRNLICKAKPLKHPIYVVICMDGYICIYTIPHNYKYFKKYLYKNGSNG